MKDDNRPLMVSIRCLTYNHEPYIRQCLEGFVMQQTNFRFEAIVHDDASTDGTATIVKEYAEKYPDIIKPIFETENQYSKHDGSLSRIMNEACRGKYIAMCEGDDYWIDPLKLQKQVDLLEKNKNISLAYSRAHIRDNDKVYGDISCSDCSFQNLLTDNCIPTATVIIRADDYFHYIEEIKPISREWMMGDYPLVLYFSLKNSICFLDMFTAVRRRLMESASSSKNLEYLLKFGNCVTEIRLFFIDNYYQCIDKETVRERVVKKDLEYKFSLNLSLGTKYKETKVLYNRIKTYFTIYKRIQYSLILNSPLSFKLYRFYQLRK